MKRALNRTRLTVGFLLGFSVILAVPALAQLVDRTMAPNAAGDIHKDLAIGAGLADTCAACHGRPRASAGAGVTWRVRLVPQRVHIGK